jgi:hypothetical protein
MAAPSDGASARAGREAVLLDIARPVDAAAVGEALVAALGLETADARTRARYCGGVVLEAADAAQADAACAVLAGHGIGARRLATGAFPAAPKPERVARLRLTDDAAHLGTAMGTEERLAWSEVRLVLAWTLTGKRRRADRDRSDLGRAALRTGEESPLSAAGSRLADALARLRRSEQAHIGLGLDLVTADRTLRLVSDRLLWERDAPPRAHSVETWLDLLRVVTDHTHLSAMCPETTALLGGLADTSLFHKPEELRRYTRWLLANR